jgi:hypothetical protein
LTVHQSLIISLVMVFAFRLRLKNSKRKYFKTQHRSVTCGLKQRPFTINQVMNPKTAIIYHYHELFPQFKPTLVFVTDIRKRAGQKIYVLVISTGLEEAHFKRRTSDFTIEITAFRNSFKSTFVSSSSSDSREEPLRLGSTGTVASLLLQLKLVNKGQTLLEDG